MEHSEEHRVGRQEAKPREGRRVRKENPVLSHDPFPHPQSVLWPAQERSGEG